MQNRDYELNCTVHYFCQLNKALKLICIPIDDIDIMKNGFYLTALIPIYVVYFLLIN
jgi:hypothetical protein